MSSASYLSPASGALGAVGMLDSGVGGLSILREFRRLAPQEPVMYYADQAHLPYGEKPIETIRGYVHAIAAYLIGRGCKMLVLPCNSANAAALHSLRAAYPTLPIVGMEPAIKPAAQATRTGAIGLLTTRATFQGELLASVVDRFAQGITIRSVICPELVLLAEEGAPETPEAYAIVRRCLAPLLGEHEAPIDQLVLGCTHFPFLETHLRNILGDGVTIVEPGPAVARQAVRVLAERGLSAPRVEGTNAPVQYLTSGDPAQFDRVASRLLQVPVSGALQQRLAEN